MKRSRANICLYTLLYPYGEKEISVQNELAYLHPEFNKVFLLPGMKAETKRDLPSNVTLVDLDLDGSSKKLNLGKAVSFIGKNLKRKFIKNLRYELSYHKQLLAKAKALKEFILANDLRNAVHYTHWFDEWTTILSFVKKDIPELKIVSRAHGFDLYEERSLFGYFPYRRQQLEAVFKVFPVSKMGATYLAERYPEYGAKIEKKYLGVDSLSRNPFKQKPIHLISISNVIPLKRIGLIVEALKLVKSEVKWTHFGSGELFDEVEASAKSLPGNVSYSLEGFVPNEELMSGLSRTSVNLFINVSTTEGLPLSMMEVMSAGIPVLATDVGGVSEIVNERTGILLGADPSADEIAKIIDDFVGHSLNTIEARQYINKYWSEHFDARKNVRSFIHFLRTLS